MNERHLTDDVLDDQLRRLYQDIYEPMEPAGQMWKKVASRLDMASPPRKGVLTTPPPARGSMIPETIPHSGGMRHRLGSTVAVLLTGIIIIASLALFHTFHVQSGIRPSVTHSVTPQAHSTLGVPVTPVATPGPQNKYVTNVVTAQGLSTEFVPVNETSHFTAGQEVYVICTVRGITKGQQHTISIHWFYDGTDMGIPSVEGKTSVVVTNDLVAYFGLDYRNPGLGMARIFFDLPSGDPGIQSNDPYLAAQITFAIDPATAGTGSGTPAGAHFASR